jgi:hypothetical protein
LQLEDVKTGIAVGEAEGVGGSEDGLFRVCED